MFTVYPWDLWLWGLEALEIFGCKLLNAQICHLLILCGCHLVAFRAFLGENSYLLPVKKELSRAVAVNQNSDMKSKQWAERLQAEPAESFILLLIWEFNILLDNTCKTSLLYSSHPCTADTTQWDQPIQMINASWSHFTDNLCRNTESVLVCLGGLFTQR